MGYKDPIMGYKDPINCKNHQQKVENSPSNAHNSKKSDPRDPRTPKKLFSIDHSSIATERGPLGIGPIQFLMETKATMIIKGQ